MDMKVQIAGARLARQVMSTPPLSGLRNAETTPRCLVPDNASDEEWKTWVFRTFNPVSHPIGTCAMMRQDMGGVVDGKLKLYGAKNVRIVDASVMPTQVSAHLSSTLYGIAEKVADMIKAGL
ncbi:5633_t:CDS:1 [Acaulospora colombiana]|uniref:5633_t:CDS:1 n=1 Tax=Acaulospora colombiana TaxID=27376 RepID=A0ACA9LCB7_9GLOM|nr:5633_t:CDS:1 [Acaulospora colombiana]